MLLYLPTRNLYTPHAATRHKHGRAVSRHRGVVKSVAPTDFPTSQWRTIHRIRRNRLPDWGDVMCKIYAGVCKILWTYPTLLKHLYINLLRTKSVRWQWKHTHSFTSRLTGRKQIFGYKLHTSFDGSNASARPLQRFCTKPICVGDYCFYITKFKYHLCYYFNLFAILAKGTVR